VRFGYRQGDAAGGEELDALEPEPQSVHRVLGVVAVYRDQFGPVGVRAGLAGYGCLLCPQVAQEPGGGQAGHEPVRVARQFCAGLVAEDDFLVRNEQHQQHGRVPGQGQPRPLPAE